MYAGRWVLRTRLDWRGSARSRSTHRHGDARETCAWCRPHPAAEPIPMDARRTVPATWPGAFWARSTSRPTWSPAASKASPAPGPNDMPADPRPGIVQPIPRASEIECPAASSHITRFPPLLSSLCPAKLGQDGPRSGRDLLPAPRYGAHHEPDPHPACGHPLPSDGRGAGGEGSFSVEVHGPNARARHVQVKALHEPGCRSGGGGIGFLGVVAGDDRAPAGVVGGTVGTGP